MRILITGGAGCLGSNLIERWLPRGDEILVIDNFATGRREVVPPVDGLTVVEGSVADAALVERCFEEQENLAEFLQAVEAEIFEIGMDKSEDASRDIAMTIDAAVLMVNSFLEGKGSMRGVSTGLKDLDGLTLGMQKSNMIVLAARPSMGKTSLAMNIAEAVAEILEIS